MFSKHTFRDVVFKGHPAVMFLLSGQPFDCEFLENHAFVWTNYADLYKRAKCSVNIDFNINFLLKWLFAFNMLWKR